MIELLLCNKDGNIWDISRIVSDITWKTSRIGKPGSFTFTLIKNGLFQDKEFKFNNGDVIRFRKDDKNVFYGYIFSIESGKDENVQISCYDQIRYLLLNGTYILSNVTASELLNIITSDFSLKIGTVDDTKHVISTLCEDGKKLLDIICKALDYTLINTGKNFFLFDDFGELSIRNSEDMILDFAIGDNSLMHNYSSKISIDDDTYNRVVLYKANSKASKKEVFKPMEDSANIAKWGLLQLYQSVDENMNEAQVYELLNNLMAIKNRETKSLKIDAIGNIGVRAGCYVPIIIEELGISQPFLVDECTHKFDGEDHTMSLNLKVI